MNVWQHRFCFLLQSLVANTSDSHEIQNEPLLLVYLDCQVQSPIAPEFAVENKYWKWSARSADMLRPFNKLAINPSSV